MQTAQLQHNEEQEKRSREIGNEEALQILQQAYSSQGDKIISEVLVMAEKVEKKTTEKKVADKKVAKKKDKKPNIFAKIA